MAKVWVGKKHSIMYFTPCFYHTIKIKVVKKTNYVDLLLLQTFVLTYAENNL